MKGWRVGIGVAVILAAVRAGVGVDGVVNSGGWSQVSRFLSAMFRPDLDSELLALTAREAAVTVGYAVVGTGLALTIGFAGGLLLSERLWTPVARPGRMGGLRRTGWTVGRVAFVVPRAMHEVVFGLVLVNILGLDPLVAVLAIGLPFGAVTAKVFGEILDEVPAEAEHAFVAAGATRPAAFVFGVLPLALGDLASYGFYRFECGLRSAAVLGVVGAGGLGFQLALSFTSLRYEQMWTFLWALILLSGLVDWWSSSVRRGRVSARMSAAVVALAVPIAVWRLEIDLSTLWAPRARTLAGELADDAWPPRVGIGGWDRLIGASIDTVALAVLALAMAWTFASIVAFVAASTGGGSVRRAVGLVVRFWLLVLRSIPPPVGAFVIVFVLFPGLWPGAVALALYNLGVLGRLQAEVVENADRRAIEALRVVGARGIGLATYGLIPTVAARFVSLGLYRWEVAIRDTVMVGVVGAGGLGLLLDEQTSAFDYDGIVATVGALFVVTVLADLGSAALRYRLR